MPVTVSLFDLVRLQGTKHLWPREFAAFADAVQKKPHDKTGWGAIADWCDEHDEPDLARGFRFMVRRGSEAGVEEMTNCRWSVYGLPDAVERELNKIMKSWATIPHLAADLSLAVSAVRDQMKKQLEELGDV